MYDQTVGPLLNMRFTFFGSRRVSRHDAGGFDYVDVTVDRSESDFQLPSTFGGVSGSGLWLLDLQCSETDYRVGALILSGVAFYEKFNTPARQTGIRCHGMKSLYEHRP